MLYSCHEEDSNTMRLRSLMITLTLLLIFAAMPVRAAEVPTPQTMLVTYYNNISLRQYSDAYAMWVKPSQTFDSLVAGYADTDHVTPYLGDFQDTNGGVAGYVPGVLVGYHTDGTITSYHGCFSVVINTLLPRGWSLEDASFDLLSNDLPDNDTILSYLALDCSSSVTVFPTVAPTPTATLESMTGKAYSTLTTYYELINKKDFAGAYALWLHPIPGPKPNGAPGEDYRTPYNDFVVGYATTKFVDVYPGTYLEEGGSAGHGYLNGEMPVLLIGQHTDGTYVAYIGCYVMGGMQGIDMGIVSGTFQQISDGVNVPSFMDNLPKLKTICNEVSLKT